MKETKPPENTMREAERESERWKVWKTRKDIEEGDDKATTDEKSDENEVKSNVEALEGNGHRGEKEVPTKDEKENIDDKKLKENYVITSVENVSEGTRKGEAKETLENNMEGEPGCTRLANHVEAERSRKLEMKPESSRRLDEGEIKAAKAKAATSAKLALIVKITGRQRAWSASTQVGITNTVQNCSAGSEEQRGCAVTGGVKKYPPERFVQN